MKTVLYEFDPVIYPFPLLISKKFDVKELIEMFYVLNTNNELENADYDTFIPTNTCIARTIFVYSKATKLGYVLILLIRPNEIFDGVISHESYHAANMIAESLGFLPEKAMNDEPVAYLIQWAANCMAFLKRGKPERMRGKLLETI